MSAELGDSLVTEGMLRRLHDGQAAIIEMQARMQEVQIRLVSFVEERLQEHLQDWRERVAAEVSSQIERALPDHLATGRPQSPASLVDPEVSCPQQEASKRPPPPLELVTTPEGTSVIVEARNVSALNLGLATTPVGTSAIVEAEERCESGERTLDPSMLEELARLEEIVRNHSHEARRRAAGCRPSSPSEATRDSAGTLSTAAASNPSLASVSTRSTTPMRPQACKQGPMVVRQEDVRDIRKQFKREQPESGLGLKARGPGVERVASLTPTSVRTSGQVGTPLAEILAVRRSISEGIPLEQSVLVDHRRSTDKIVRKVPGFGGGNSPSHNSFMGQRTPPHTPTNASSGGLAATASASLGGGRFRRSFRRSPRQDGQMVMVKRPTSQHSLPATPKQPSTPQWQPPPKMQQWPSSHAAVEGSIPSDQSCCLDEACGERAYMLGPGPAGASVTIRAARS